MSDRDIKNGYKNPTVYYFYPATGSNSLSLVDFKILNSDTFYFIGADTQFSTKISSQRSFLMKNDFSNVFDKIDQKLCINIIQDPTELTMTLNLITESKLLDLESILESREFSTRTRWRPTEEVHMAYTRGLLPLEQICETDLSISNDPMFN